jgi:ABC-type multidrug transport system ATPase subunit/ABC-type multidrug transport system permease subunit
MELTDKSTGAETRDITWSNVSFNVRDTPILHNVHGTARSGEVVAIMGPSGAGKSSLLNVLAGRSASGGHTQVRGTVMVDGKVINPVAYRKNIAYVMQDDALFRTSTPREALAFSARLRLPKETTDEQINNDVNALLKELLLEDCADVMIGGELIPGISGGQRKRTSVGVEIITKPSILFLDEPTSGLDSFAAYNLVNILKEVAKTNCPVLCTIHQPSSEIFYLFDQAIFLKSGRIFWQGSTSALAKDFTMHGYPCPENYNPCDHAMFTCQTIENDVLEGKGFFAKQEGNAALKDADLSMDDAMKMDVEDNSIENASDFSLQVSELFARDWANVKRDKGALIGRFGITILLNVLFGLIFYQAGQGDDGDPEEFSAHFGAITMIAISSMFGSAQPTLLTFPFERPMFLREYSTGTYNAKAYFLSKWVVEIPLSFAQTLVQYLVVYWLVGMRGNFFYLVLAALGNGLCASSLALVAGCAISDVKTVTEISPLLFVPQLLFSGFFIRISMVPIFLRWAQYLCALKYSLNLILLIEFQPTNPNCEESAASEIMCENVLEDNDIVASEWWFYMLLLLIIFFAFRIIAGFVLVSRAKKFY